MKSLMIAVIAFLGLAGCVAVPYHAGPEPGYYYGAPVAPAIQFRYDYHHHRHHRNHYR